MKVAIIGAGAAGLITGRVLRDAGMKIDIFEQAPALGGIWRYNQPENTNRVLYRGLKTNLPKEIMQFYSMPFDHSLPSFLTSTNVLGYLQTYANHFKLNDSILFNRTVVSVDPFFGHNQQSLHQPKHWILNHENTRCRNDILTKEYDFVVVANGHYEVPNWPKDEELCDGFSSFPGEVIHSHDYDDPSKYANKSVVIIGSGASGADLAREISQVANSVVVIDRHSNPNNDKACRTLPYIEIGGERRNIYRCGSIHHILSNGDVVFNALQRTEENVEEKFEMCADVILLCTGYEYSFPFLKSTSRPSDLQLQRIEGSGGGGGVEDALIESYDRRVHPLYLQLFHAVYPSMAFVGIPFLVVPFPFFETQANLLAAVYTSGSIDRALPSREERMGWVASLYERQGAVRNTHRMGELQWEYCHDLLQRARAISESAKQEEDINGHSNRKKQKIFSTLGVTDFDLDQAIDLNRQIYEDVKRPSFPGSPDASRKKEYSIDRANNTWFVKPPSTEEIN